MFSYFAYGLGIQSELPLPELVPAQAGDDVVIRLQGDDGIPSEVAGQEWYWRISSDDAVLSLKDVGVFLIREGREITVIPASGAEESLLRLYLVGNIMAILLYQRGLLVLHASAVEVNGHAVAFLGGSGSGKSSMAAALCARGHAIIADDVTAVKVKPNASLVFPGFPQLKLSEEAAAALGYDASSLFLLHPQEEKLGCRVVERFSQATRPLERIYVLAQDTPQTIELIRPQEAVIELIRHSYPTRLLQDGGASHFLQCGHLAKQVPFYRITRPLSLPSLPELATQVEEHILQGTR